MTPLNTVPGRRPTPFVEAGRETSDTGAEAVKPDPRCRSGRVCANIGDESTESRSAVQPIRISSVIQCAAHMLLSEELMSCYAAGTNGCLDLRCRAFALGGHWTGER